MQVLFIVSVLVFINSLCLLKVRVIRLRIAMTAVHRRWSSQELEGISKCPPTLRGSAQSLSCSNWCEKCEPNLWNTSLCLWRPSTTSTAAPTFSPGEVGSAGELAADNTSPPPIGSERRSLSRPHCSSLQPAGRQLDWGRAHSSQRVISLTLS